MRTMDFNSDLGESYGHWKLGADEELMASISSANVACGFHAGDPGTMRVAVASAKRHGVAVGAHPGLPDLLGFGRREMAVAAAEIEDYVLYQAGALAAFVRAQGMELHHVKPHGALYMMALDDGAVARAIATAVARLDERLAIYTLAGGELWDAAQAVGVRAEAEFFADRPLLGDGSVLMFNWQERFDPTPAVVAERVRSLVTTGLVPTLDGDSVAVSASTVCVHSDTPLAGEIGRALRAALEAEGVSITSTRVPSGAGTKEERSDE